MSHESCFSNIKTVLVVISSKAMTLDLSALRNYITHAYPGTAVFFISTSGDPIGVEAPSKVDLLIDFTPPHARQSWFFAYRLRKQARSAVGRNSGRFYRMRNYDRVYDEFNESIKKTLPIDYLEQEAWAQRKVLELAGVPVIRQGGVGQDRGKDIALELPPMQK